MSGERDRGAGALWRPGPAVYRILLHAYPAPFRRRFAPDMLADYRELSSTERYGGLRGRLALWGRLVRDLVTSAPRERFRGTSGAGPRSSGWSPRGLASDFGHGLRSLRARPGFVAVVVLTLAVGLGPMTAVYSLGSWLMLRPLPGVDDRGDLGFVWYGEASDRGVSVRRITYANLEDMTPRLETLVGFTGVQGGSAVAVFDNGEAEALRASFVSASFFPTLGLEPIAGRVFSPAEDEPADHGSPVAVISHRLAAARFGDPESAVGESFHANRRQIEIVGVLPAGFHGPQRTDGVDLWLPGSSVFWIRNFPEQYDAAARGRGAGFYEFVARRAPGATWEQVEAELAGLDQWLAETWPDDNAGLVESGFLVYPGIGTPPLGRELLARTLWLLTAVVGCILVVACANVSNLMLMRGLDRRGEIAVQKALGAGTARLVRRTLLESLLLCGFGALVGLAIARGLLRLYQGARLSGLFQPIGEVPLDWRVGGFAAGLCVVVAALTSLLPALGAARVDVGRWLSESARTSTGGGRRWRTALGVLQLAAAVPLLIGALLFGRTLHELNQVELGFEPAGVHLLVANASDLGYGMDEMFLYYRQLMEEVRELPEVRSATIAGGVPLFGSQWTRIRPPGAADDEVVQPMENEVGADYFQILEIPVLQGRTFAPEEILAGPERTTDLVVLSASLAQQLFGTTRAVGRTVDFAFSLRQERPFRVIGVVGDVPGTGLTEGPTPIAYTPLGVDGRPPRGFLVVEGSAVGGRLERAVAEAGRRVDPFLPVVPLGRAPTLDAVIEMQLSERTLLARLFTSLSVTALVLAAIGLYATVGRSVIARTREIGLRKALGADTPRTLLWVLRRALATTTIGLGVGCALGYYGIRLIESRLHGVTPLDPVTWASALATLALVATLAAALPARRAVRLDPARALRVER